MVIDIEYITTSVGQFSRCLCAVSGETPCWHCNPTAFLVWFYARYNGQPIRSMPLAGGWQPSACILGWRVLEEEAGVSTEHAKHLHVPYEISYDSNSSMWAVTNYATMQEAASLKLALLKYRKAVQLDYLDRRNRKNQNNGH